MDLPEERLDANEGVAPLGQILEGLLFCSADPLSLAKMEEILENGATRDEIRAELEVLQASYASTRRAFVLKEVAGGWQIFTREDLDPFVRKLRNLESRPRLSRAAIETLAIIAYKQPILRADLEAIRGVHSGHLLRSLMDLGFVRITGHADTMGRPILYGTTRKFLEVLGIRDLADLPRLEEVS